MICAIVGVLNLAVNAAQYVGYQQGPVRFDAEVGRLARSLLTAGGFADPFGAGPTGPSAHTPPVFPGLYAAYVVVLGESPAAWMAIKLAAGVALSAWVGLLPLVSRRFGLGVKPGVVGALLAMASALRHFPEWDANYTALLLVVLAIVAAPMVWSDAQDLAAEPPQDARDATSATGVSSPASWGLGGLWALAMHVNAMALILFALWSAAVVWRRRHRLACVPWVGAILFPVLLLVPWTTRNWMVLGSPVLLRGNLGLELAVANNDCASPGLLQNLASGCFARQHPDESPAEAARMRSLGEPAYHAQRMVEARAWIAAHPERFVRLTARRLALFWLPSPLDDLGREWAESTPPRRARVVWLSTVLMVAGLMLLVRQAPVRATVLAVPLVVMSALYAPVQFEDRYRYPILWVTFLVAGYALVAIWERVRPGATS
jgi:hypothetical protein